MNIKKNLKDILPISVLSVIQSINRQRIKNKILRNWKDNGYPIPPPHELKQTVIEQYAIRYSAKILVETGTYYGDMVESQRKKFKQIFSIELSDNLWVNAAERFKKYKHIIILQGDSGKVLNQITPLLKEPAIFWLDGHYSDGITAKGDKDCPIIEELDAIFQHTNLNHIILIDDARCFNGNGDYPTIEKLTQHIHQYNPRYKLELKYDILRYFI